MEWKLEKRIVKGRQVLFKVLVETEEEIIAEKLEAAQNTVGMEGAFCGEEMTRLLDSKYPYGQYLCFGFSDPWLDCCLLMKHVWCKHVKDNDYHKWLNDNIKSCYRQKGQNAA